MRNMYGVSNSCKIGLNGWLVCLFFEILISFFFFLSFSCKICLKGYDLWESNMGLL